MNNSNSIFSPTHISSYFFFKSHNTYTQRLAKTDKHGVPENQCIVFCMRASEEEILAGISSIYLFILNSFKE